MKTINIDKHSDGINIAMDKRFLNKNFCKEYANFLINNKYIKNMSNMEIAQEIFTHAFCYYWYNEKNFLHSNNIARELARHGEDGIYLQHGGDTEVRKAFYILIWHSAIV